MALSVPEFVAYREVRGVIVDHLAAGELPTGSPKRRRLELLACELGLEIADADVTSADVESYYAAEVAPAPLSSAAEEAVDRAARQLVRRSHLHAIDGGLASEEEAPPRPRERSGGMAAEVSSRLHGPSYSRPVRSA